jgi:PAS domain S-box-containing protein
MGSRRRSGVVSTGRRRVSHRDILDSVGAGIYAADLQGRFLYFNARALKTLGYTVADAKRLLGTSFFDILAPGQNADAADRMRSGAQRPLDDHHFRLDVRRKDGTTVTLEIWATPLWHKSAVAGRVGVARVVDPKEESRSDADDVKRAVRKERDRIARALKSHVVDVVYGAGAVDNGAPAVIVGDVPPSPGDVLRRHALDDTDIAILRLVIKGASNPEIGRQVHLSAAAVKDRIGRLMRRLGAHRRAELSAQALRAGIA